MCYLGFFRVILGIWNIKWKLLFRVEGFRGLGFCV